VASDAILATLRGHFTHDPASELPPCLTPSRSLVVCSR
jgi:hypothetical protein